MRRITGSFKLDYRLLESRQLLAGDLGGLGPTSLAWTDVAGNNIGSEQIPNRTEITARLVSNNALPDTLTASIFEDDTFFDDFVTDILLTRINANTWTGTWQALWSDDGTGLPEYYFQVAGVSGSSNSINVLQGNAWHAQENATGALTTTSQAGVNFDPAQVPAGLSLDQIAIEIEFGNVSFANSPHAFEIVVAGPHDGWSETIIVDQGFDFSNPVVEVYRTAGCDDACSGNDFSSSFLAEGLAEGFYGNWSVSANNLQTGDVIGIANLRTTLTFHSRLNLSGYDSNLQPDDPLPKSRRDYGYISDFDNVELTATTATKAAIFIHGWNPGTNGLGFSFSEHYGGKFWESIEQNISTFVAETSDWLVGQYDWINDAATGPSSVASILATLASAPLASRDVGTAHGPFLGRALFGASASLFSQLESVQFIAHSAGNWVALEAAAYLRAAGFTGDLQLTSLDPFVPDVGTALGITAGVETERIFEAGAEHFNHPNDVLDNYYVDDSETDVFFGWTSGDYSPWTINRRLDATSPAPLFQSGFDIHSGPIGWYGATAEFLYNGGDLNDLQEGKQSLGFGSSLLFQDWRFENAMEIAADSIQIIRGIQAGGSLANLNLSDDIDLSLQPGDIPPANEPTILVEMESTLRTNDPDILGFRFESSSNTFNIVQSIEVFNFDSGSYEQIDVRESTFSDSIVAVQLAGDVSRFVGTTGAVKARIGWQPSGPVLLYPWTVNIDQAVWLTEPAGSPQPIVLPPVNSGIHPASFDDYFKRLHAAVR